MPCSSSAFWTFQQGCAPILTHIFGQRWSLIATIEPSYVGMLRGLYSDTSPPRELRRQRGCEGRGRTSVRVVRASRVSVTWVHPRTFAGTFARLGRASVP